MRYYLTGKERLLVAALAFILPFSFAKAEVREDGKTGQQGWYVGVEGGMPFGFSTFSSFGHDKTQLGWAAGCIMKAARARPIYNNVCFIRIINYKLLTILPRSGLQS